jgi:hypothetical protein
MLGTTGFADEHALILYVYLNNYDDEAEESVLTVCLHARKTLCSMLTTFRSTTLRPTASDGLIRCQNLHVSALRGVWAYDTNLLQNCLLQECCVCSSSLHIPSLTCVVMCLLHFRNLLCRSFVSLKTCPIFSSGYHSC